MRLLERVRDVSADQSERRNGGVHRGGGLATLHHHVDPSWELVWNRRGPLADLGKLHFAFYGHQLKAEGGEH